MQMSCAEKGRRRVKQRADVRGWNGRPAPVRRVATWSIALAIASSSLGCGSLTGLAADTTAQFLADAAPAARAYFDYETAGHAAANGLLQLEGLHRVTPGHDRLTISMAQGYIAYAFGWVMDKQEEAQINRRYEEADREEARAYLMYTRATALMLRLMRERDAGIDAALKSEPEQLKAYLRKHYPDREEDTEIVFWCAVAWGSAITNSPSLDAVVDLPTVKVLAQHSIDLDEKYENAGALALLGGIESSIPQQVGGDWKKGRAYFERALRLSGRRNHLHQINFARIYAVNAQDKPLFVALMREVLEAGDQGDDVRLSNKVARRRAERYLTHLDELFSAP
jgi:hypothetical protein